MIGRGVVVVLSMALFVVAFMVTGLAALFLTGSLERAALIGGVCGFAAAWITDTAYIIGQRTERETSGEIDNKSINQATTRTARESEIFRGDQGSVVA